MTRRFRPLTLSSFFILGLAALTGAGQAQPGPRAFVSNLDVRCYQIPDQPSLGVSLRLDHLNPVLRELGAQPHEVVLQKPQQLCVPVAKNRVFPPQDVLPYIQYLDWKCYGIEGPSLDIQLRLDHLNPVIAALIGPRDEVIVREPQQLCVPVAKDDKFPPDDVRKLVEWIDVECFRVEARQEFGDLPINLTHLNPLFADLPSEDAKILAKRATQLCVPVAKNGKFPPDDVIKTVEFSDVLCYALSGKELNKKLRLTHLNPVLVEMGLDVENVFVTKTEKLCVPVAKNRAFPPD